MIKLRFRKNCALQNVTQWSYSSKLGLDCSKVYVPYILLQCICWTGAVDGNYWGRLQWDELESKNYPRCIKPRWLYWIGASILFLKMCEWRLIFPWWGCYEGSNHWRRWTARWLGNRYCLTATHRASFWTRHEVTSCMDGSFVTVCEMCVGCMCAGWGRDVQWNFLWFPYRSACLCLCSSLHPHVLHTVAWVNGSSQRSQSLLPCSVFHSAYYWLAKLSTLLIILIVFWSVSPVPFS